MNREQELEQMLEKGRKWLAQQRDIYFTTGRKHPKYEEQLEKFCEYWSELDDLQKEFKDYFRK